MLLTRRFSPSQNVFSYIFFFFFFGGGGGGKSTTFTLFAFRYAVVVLAQWAGAPSCSTELHSSMVSQQCNDLHIQHFVLITSFMKTMLVLRCKDTPAHTISEPPP